MRAAVLASLGLSLFLGACASPRPIVWQPDQRQIMLVGQGPLLTAPESWQLVEQQPWRWRFRFPGGALLIAVDGERMSHTRAARGVRELLRELDGKQAAQTPAKTFGIAYDELVADFEFPDGKQRHALHRTFPCGTLHCHFTLICTDEEEARVADNLPHMQAPKTRTQRAGLDTRGLRQGLDFVGTLAGFGARIAEPVLRDLARHRAGQP